MLADSFSSWLASGKRRIGQVTLISPAESGRAGWLLCHQTDEAAARAGGAGLEAIHGCDGARELVGFAADGSYRPLRGSPDLRHGWIIEAADVAELREILDMIYPAALGLWRACLDGTVPVVDLRSKLARQTGMYRFANSISDAGAMELIGNVCDPGNGCIKRILWPLAPGQEIHSLPACKFLGRGENPADDEIPVVCQEACNLLVAKAKEVARREYQAANP